MPLASRKNLWPFVLAGVAILSLYTIHLRSCQQSTLQYLDAVFQDSDMHANLLWAQNIEKQGWLDPAPYHPYTGWMQSIAPYSQWVQWWGGEQIYQQSPLYVYLLTLFLHRYFWMRILQALLSIGMCVFVGLLTARVAGRTAGWIAFWLAALYAPFYAYSWPFLRDGLAWFFMAGTLWALCELTAPAQSPERAETFAWLAGLFLGLGYLARETFLLVIPVVWLTLALLAWKRRTWPILARVAIATVLAISPLVIRNWEVKAPLLSSSNRAAEFIIQGNSGSTDPIVILMPEETGPILTYTHARLPAVVRATIASHPNRMRGLIRLQLVKLRTLFDPYEPPDNLCIYFVEHISPVVRFGLRYWMILPFALAGFVLSFVHRENAQLWIWILLPISFFSLLAGAPISRYRQSLMVFLIPCAGYFLALLWSLARQREFRKVAVHVALIAVSWGLMLGPLARRPRSQYERPQEYLLSARIFRTLGDQGGEQAMLSQVRKKFPGLLAN